ncbi:unnamed protein product [Orchesella dallaii]|uniref:Protein kinase domain-containing protein n=1 Tax=Orchesella dallaii TaxID=48710 RepID=A0ABP1S1V0_9HEXA
MEELERKIICNNIDKLITNTICNPVLLAKFQALGILSSDEVEELNTHRNDPSNQAYKFYGIIQGRKNAFVSLQQVLRETNQTGALEILENEYRTLKRKCSALDDICSITYDVKTVLGKGSYGTVVYKGKLGQRDVAVKLVHSDILDGEQAIHEVDILKTCDEHENIVRYFGSKEGPPNSNSILIILELCDMSLKEWVKTKSIQISPLNILKQVTVGLEWLHGNDIVHRDIKPENILLNGRLPKVKISDFGLSRRIVDGRSCVSISTLGGTQGWVAPEILAQLQTIEEDPQKCKFTKASDVFALGCLYYFVITDGKHPFGDRFRSQVNILDGTLLIDNDHVLHCCSQNVLFIKLMLSKNPISRPTCSVILSFPIFWEVDRCIKFIEGLMAQSNDITKKLMNWDRDAVCRLDHKNEILALRSLLVDEVEVGLGCVIPFLYLNFHSLKEAETAVNGGFVKGTEENDQVATKFQNSNDFEIKPEAGEVQPNIKERKSKTRTGDSTEKNNKPSEKSYSNAIPHSFTKQMKSNARNSDQDQLPAEIKFYSLKTSRTNRHYGAISSAKNYKLILLLFLVEFLVLENGLDYHIIKIERAITFLNKAESNDGIQLLYQIVMTEDLETIKGVFQNIRKTVDITEVWDENLKSLLHVAVEHRGHPIVRLLVHQLGFSDVLSSPSMSDLIHVCLSGSEFIQLPIFKDKLKNIGLLDDMQLEVISMLIHNKANVNAQDDDGQSPLHYLFNQKPVPTHFPQIIKLLIDNEADPELVDKSGRTFLHCAAYNLFPSFYLYLVREQLSIGRTEIFSSVDSHGSTILHFAVNFLEPFPETLRIFKEHGIDFNVVDENGNSVVFCAIRGGRSGTFLDSLFTSGADLKILNNIGDTSLHCAVFSGNLPAFKLLTSLGHDINMKNSEWDTQLHEALQRPNDSVFEVVGELVNNKAHRRVQSKLEIISFDLKKILIQMEKLT